MYYIKIYETQNHTISAEYNIPANIVIFNRQSHVDGEIVDVSIGMSVDELISATEKIKYRKNQRKNGIDPPDSELKSKGEGWYADKMV